MDGVLTEFIEAYTTGFIILRSIRKQKNWSDDVTTGVALVGLFSPLLLFLTIYTYIYICLFFTLYTSFPPSFSLVFHAHVSLSLSLLLPRDSFGWLFRRLITLHRPSHKTTFNLGQREKRVYTSTLYTYICIYYWNTNFLSKHYIQRYNLKKRKFFFLHLPRKIKKKVIINKNEWIL